MTRPLPPPVAGKLSSLPATTAGMVGAVLLLAALQRSPVAGLGAALPELHLPGIVTALLTAAPAWCITLACLTVPWLETRWGTQPLLTACAAVLTLAIGLRVLAGPVLLVTGSLLAYFAIAVAGVLLPAYVRSTFGSQSGTITASYAAMISAGVALASVLTPALVEGGVSWRWALGIAALPAGVAWLLWRRMPPAQVVTSSGPATMTSHAGQRFRRSVRAWLLAVFFGLQSLLAVSMLSWQPAILRAAGISPVTAGWLVTLTMAVSVLTALTLGSWCNQARQQTSGLVFMTACGGLGLGGLWLAPTTLPWLWAALLGIGLSVLSTALALPAMRTGNHSHAVRLSALTQGVGYALAALGPAALSLTSPTVGLVILLICALAQLALAFPVGKAHPITPR